MSIPPPLPNEVEIFESLPPEDEDTFNSGIPVESTQQGEFSIILFSPNLQLVASLDNTQSAVTTNYETSITRGFKFSETSSFSIGSNVGVGIRMVSVGVTTTMALSITEEWNESTTKKMTFSCPPGEQAFAYQGTLRSRILQFDPGSGHFEWDGPSTQTLTDALVTSREPIGKAPSNDVLVEKL